MNEESDGAVEELFAISWPTRSEKSDGRDWDSAFERLLAFMDRDDAIADDDRPLLSDHAAERLGGAIADEASDRYDFVWPKVSEARARLRPIFDALDAREARAPGAIEAFSRGLGGLRTFHHLHQVLILEWLQGLGAQGLDTPGRLIAEIRLWPWGDSAPRARPILVGFLDHADSLVRAVAAEELGKTFDDIEPQFPEEWAELEGVLQDVKSAELRSPGVASAFIWGLPYRVRDDARLAAWVFDLLVERTGVEPEVRYFNSLEWVAAEEILNKSSAWIPRLVSAGKKDLANWVALSSDVRNREVESQLVGMTHDPDDWTARAAATSLALYYGTTTAAATNRGFVKVQDEQPLYRTFVVYDHDDLANPRILVLYPRHPRRSLTRTEADAAIDLLVPTDLRGNEVPQKALAPRTGRREFSNRTYVNYDLAGKKSPRVRRIAITGNGIQGPAWDPIALLRSRRIGE
ncbi:MAG: hypothetical protein ABI577_14325 [bacterium]